MPRSFACREQGSAAVRSLFIAEAGGGALELTRSSAQASNGRGETPPTTEWGGNQLTEHGLARLCLPPLFRGGRNSWCLERLWRPRGHVNQFGSPCGAPHCSEYGDSLSIWASSKRCLGPSGSRRGQFTASYRCDGEDESREVPSACYPPARWVH